MRLNHILPLKIRPLESKLGLPVALMISATLIMSMVLLSLVMIFVVRAFSAEWQTGIVERYAVVLSLGSDESIYAESYRQELADFLDEEEVVDSYTVLTEEQIRNEMEDSLAKFPATYEYTLPIIAYVSLASRLAPEFLAQLREIHEGITLEDRGVWMETFHEVASFLYNGSSWIGGIIILIALMSIILHLYILVEDRQKTIKRMAQLGASDGMISSLVGHYCFRWMLVVGLLAAGISGAALLVVYIYADTALPVPLPSYMLNWFPFLPPLWCLVLGFIAWMVGLWRARLVLRRYMEG